MLGKKAIECARNCLRVKTAFRLTVPEKDQIVLNRNIPFIFHYYNYDDWQKFYWPMTPINKLEKPAGD